MRLYQQWEGCIDNGKEDYFKVNVPGNFQADYGKSHNYGELNYSKNFEKYKWLEDKGTIYKTEFSYDLKNDERLFFVSEGIDYDFIIMLNNKKIYSQEGMFSPIDIDITDNLLKHNVLKVFIAPPPKRSGALLDDRMEADKSVKPVVSYGWDWHPRLIPTGIWDETYLETRNKGFIEHCEAFYELSEGLNRVRVQFEIKCNETAFIEVLSPSGDVVYNGSETNFEITNPYLWWCNGQGEPNLYTYCVYTDTDKKTGKIGFRKVELVMNEGAWDEPSVFPKTRSVPPITIRLNGRNIFAKGSNWVNPEIFTGMITRETYIPLLNMAKDANMNMLRCWGGAIVNKRAFYDICDELGLMVWQEFPLACNNYGNSKEYLNVLNCEATSIVKKLRRHPCIVMWCGGNELFNNWSQMTDQSLALRLLNKICYENDREKPFIATSPLMGMGHGHYVFYDFGMNKDVYQIYNYSSNTAYTEFGVSSISNVDVLKKIIPPEEYDAIAPGTSWEAHHGYNSWGETRWLCLDILERYFGEYKEFDIAVQQSQWLQCEGLKAIFEEARRQKPYCSMALSWCYNEPWQTAANNSIVMYPSQPKPAYYAVKEALRPVLLSARLEKFEYYAGETFTAELWLLNDSPYDVEDFCAAYVIIDGKEYSELKWNTGVVKANENKKGHILQIILPESIESRLTLKLESALGNGSNYTLSLKPNINANISRQLNI